MVNEVLTTEMDVVGRPFCNSVISGFQRPLAVNLLSIGVSSIGRQFAAANSMFGRSYNTIRVVGAHVNHRRWAL